MLPQRSAPALQSFVQVGSRTTSFPIDAEGARLQFRECHAIGLADLFEAQLLRTILDGCRSTHFGAGDGAPGFREVELSPQRIGRLINFVLNRPAFLRWMEEVTGCGRLATVEGRLTQTLYRPGDELHWHDDFVEEERRRLAIVINLGTEPFAGGEFAIRPKGGCIIFEHQYREVGSALIFDVARHLEHRVRPLLGGGPRRVFAGWAFQAVV